MKTSLDNEKNGFSVLIEDAVLRFNALHFITYSFREKKHIFQKLEPLHGHDFRVRMKLEGPLGEDQTVIDFVAVSQELSRILSKLNHKVLLARYSPHFIYKKKDGCLKINFCEDIQEKNLDKSIEFDKKTTNPSFFHQSILVNEIEFKKVFYELNKPVLRWMFPVQDVLFLPIVNTTAEEIAMFIGNCFKRSVLKKRWFPKNDIHRYSFQILLEESPGMSALCCFNFSDRNLKWTESIRRDSFF